MTKTCIIYVCKDLLYSVCLHIIDYFYLYVFADINDCVGVTCNNGGSCNDGLNLYTCQCIAGYTGTHCDTGKVAVAQTTYSVGKPSAR